MAKTTLLALGNQKQTRRREKKKFFHVIPFNLMEYFENLKEKKITKKTRTN